jgi:hypothetical protein
MNKTNLRLYIALTLLFVVSVMGISLAVSAYDSPKVIVQGDYIEAQQTEMVGAVASPNIYSDVKIFGTLSSKRANKTLAGLGTIYATTTLTVDDSGTNLFLAGTGTTIYLPNVSYTGAHFRFTINGASGIGNYMITSPEGDNINGSLIVAGAIVDCSDNDAINFIVDGEDIGDYVELISDGTQWLIQGSNGLTASKITCTG